MSHITPYVTFRNTALFFTATMLLPERLNLAGMLLHKLASNFFGNIIGGATDGIVMKTAGAAKEPFIQNLDSDAVAKIFVEKVVQAWENFWPGIGLQQGDFGKKLREILIKEWENFAISSGADPAQTSAKISKMIQDIIKNFNAGQVSDTVSNEMNSAFETFMDNFELAEKMRQIAEEIRKAMEQSTLEVGPGIRQSLYNTVGQLFKGLTFDLLPYFLINTAAVIATPLTIYYVYRKALHNIGRPKLATEVHQRTILTSLTERVKSVASLIFVSKQKKPIFSPDITRRIDELANATQNIRKNGGYFQNVLFYGPGGTGKTMISEYIAKNSGMSYIKMSGGDLAQYIKRGEHVTELNKLLDKMNLSWRPWSSRPWILFIDEAESLCRDRSTISTAELLELQNALLNRTGTESDKFMIIFSTNRMEDLDEAVLTRMDHKIYIGPPAEAERVRILKSYIPQFFSRSEQTEFLPDTQIHRIARLTDGLTGRALFKLLNVISNKKAATDNRKLTQPMIDQSINDMIEQEKAVEKRRALKATHKPKLSK